MPTRRKLHAGTIIAALGAAALAVVWSVLPGSATLERFELRALDARFVTRGPRAPSGQVVIVEVDDRSLAAVGAWPWPRGHFADLLQRLAERGAAAVVFDVLYVEPDREGGQGDAALASTGHETGVAYHGAAALQAAVAGSGSGAAAVATLERFALEGSRVVPGHGLDAFASIHQAEAVLAPLPVLARSARGVGFVDAPASRDGVYRHTLPVVEFRGDLYPSLPFTVAMQALDVAPEEVTVRLGREVRLGTKGRIAIDRSGAALIDFAGPDRTFQYYSACDVLTGAGTIPADAFTDRIVLVAATATGLYDLRASPFSAVFNGVETQANALENILEGRSVSRQRPEWVALYTLAWGLVVGLVLPLVSPRMYIPVGAGLLLCQLLMAELHFSVYGLVVAVVIPGVGAVFALCAAGAHEIIHYERRQRSLLQALTRLVPEEVALRMADEDAAAMFSGDRRVVTVLFADLRGFTSASARMSPEDTLGLLNRYFHLMHEVIREFGGTLDKFIGDELMAFFNAPVEQIDHAALAVAAALEMQRHIEAHRDEWAYHGMPDLAATVGINTGEVVVGYVGSQQRMQYTVIGSAVNAAARLESLAKELNVKILIGESTRQLVEGLVECRDRGGFTVHGLPGETRAYEVVSMTSRLPDAPNPEIPGG